MKLTRSCILLLAVIASLQFSLSLHANKPAWPDVTDPLAGMGVNIHFTDAKPGELEMLSQAGFRWIRMDFGWSRTEQKPGIYDFSAYDRLLADLDKFHIRPLFILDYGNALYDGGNAPCTEEGRAAFTRWAVSAATHFKDRGVLWEIWNEPNLPQFWKPKPNADDYAKLGLSVSQALQKAVPHEQIVGPALSGSKPDFVETQGKAGLFSSWSGLTIHPYLRTGPETYGVAYDRFRQLIKTYAAPNQQLDVLCGESGYSSIWPGMDETTQGKYLARLFLFNVLSGVPLTIWYDWHDDGLEPKEMEHHFGIVRNAYRSGEPQVYEPKPAYDAALTYGHQLQGFRFKERLKTASTDDYVLVFTKDSTQCLVAWTSASTPHVVEIPVPEGTYYSSTGFDGKSHANVWTSHGTLPVKIDEGPQYLVATGESPAQQYLSIFLSIDQPAPHGKAEILRSYEDALSKIKKIKASYPTFETQLIDRRIQDTEKKIAELRASPNDAATKP